MRDYGDWCRDRGYDFIPLVQETYGTWGKQACAFLRSLATGKFGHNVDAKKRIADFINRAKKLLSFSLQAGNGAISAVGCVTVRRATAVRVGMVGARQQPSRVAARVAADRRFAQRIAEEWDDDDHSSADPSE